MRLWFNYFLKKNVEKNILKKCYSRFLLHNSHRRVVAHLLIANYEEATSGAQSYIFLTPRNHGIMVQLLFKEKCRKKYFKIMLFEVPTTQQPPPGSCTFANSKL